MTRKIVTTGALLAILGLIVVVCFLLLPFAADRYVAPRVAAALPFANVRLSIATITPWRASGSLALVDDAGRGISVPRFELNYLPGSLLAGEIDSLVIDSPRITLVQGEGGMTVSGYVRREAGEAATAKSDAPPLLPVTVAEIRVDDAVLSVQGRERSADISLRGALHLDYGNAGGDGRQLAAVRGSFTAAGPTPLRADFDYEWQGKGGTLRFNSMLERLDGAARVLALPDNIRPSGRVAVEGRIETEGLTRLRRYEGRVRIDEFNLKHEAVVLQGGEDSSLQAEVSGTAEKADIRLTGLRLAAPEPAALTFSAGYTFTDGLLDATAEIRPERTGSELSLRLRGQTAPTLDLRYSLDGEGFRVDDAIEVASFSAEGTLSRDEDGLAAVLRASLPEVRDAKRGIAFKGIAVDLPFNSPELAPGVVIPGNVFIDDIVYGGTSAARLDGAVSLSTGGLEYSGRFTTPLNEEVSLTCSGEVIPGEGGRLDCLLPAVEVAASQLREVVPLPEKLDFGGTVAAEARFELRGGRPSGRARISCEAGSVSFDDYRAGGISTVVNFPELPAIRSAPGQTLTIGDLELGKITMRDAALRFRIDDAETLFVERAKLAWCGGRVETAGLMITKGMGQLDATLYCDRLGFTDLLGQLGIGDASGEGSLNGRLPVRLSRSDIEFDNGFLFSTPGQSGIVRFRDTEQFRRGMGEASRSVYLEYSLAALENFSYNWTRLTFNTEGDDLLLALQLDGKPAEPLAYGYREGRIVKDEEGSGLQHPIRLDVNFRLPLQELFRYGKNIQAIMENM